MQAVNKYFHVPFWFSVGFLLVFCWFSVGSLLWRQLSGPWYLGLGQVCSITPGFDFSHSSRVVPVQSLETSRQMKKKKNSPVLQNVDSFQDIRELCKRHNKRTENKKHEKRKRMVDVVKFVSLCHYIYNVPLTQIWHIHAYIYICLEGLGHWSARLLQKRKVPLFLVPSHHQYISLPNLWSLPSLRYTWYWK